MGPMDDPCDLMWQEILPLELMLGGSGTWPSACVGETTSAVRYRMGRPTDDRVIYEDLPASGITLLVIPDGTGDRNILHCEPGLC